jgi:N-methylhydantoinase A
VRIAVARMATALRDVSVNRGLDPRDFALLAYGGAGPMHAAELAEELDIAHVIVPPVPGNFSALGLIMSDLRHDFVQSRSVRVSDLAVADYEEIFGELEEEGRERLRAEGFDDGRIAIARTADMRFAGQWFDLNVPMPSEPADMMEIDGLFRRAHLDRYQIDMDRPVEFVNFRVAARGMVDKPALAGRAVPGSGTPEARCRRHVHLDGRGREVPVYDRAVLRAGVELAGPAIVEELGSTTLVTERFTFQADATGALIMERAA